MITSSNNYALSVITFYQGCTTTIHLNSEYTCKGNKYSANVKLYLSMSEREGVVASLFFKISSSFNDFERVIHVFISSQPDRGNFLSVVSVRPDSQDADGSDLQLVF